MHYGGTSVWLYGVAKVIRSGMCMRYHEPALPERAEYRRDVPLEPANTCVWREPLAAQHMKPAGKVPEGAHRAAEVEA